MKLHALARKMRLLAIAGAAVFALSIGISHVQNNSSGKQAAMLPAQTLIVDGSESTGGKPPKPHQGRVDNQMRPLFADGSESTGKPPKPKLV